MSRRGRQSQRKKCDCDDPVGKWTAWSEENPGRRFIGCRNYKVMYKCFREIQHLHIELFKCCIVQDASKDCGFFDWVDPPLPNQWYKDMLIAFHNQANEDYDDDFVELRAEPVAQVVQGPQMAVEGGFVAGCWKQMFWVCLVFTVWLIGFVAGSLKV